MLNVSFQLVGPTNYLCRVAKLTRRNRLMKETVITNGNNTMTGNEDNNSATEHTLLL